MSSLSPATDQSICLFIPRLISLFLIVKVKSEDNKNCFQHRSDTKVMTDKFLLVLIWTITLKLHIFLSKTPGFGESVFCI